MKSSAPGKLFLIGEYAVLQGGPAVLVPLPQRAIAELIDDGASQLTTITVDAQHQSVSHGLVHEPLLRAVVTTLDCATRLEASSLVLDSAQFFRQGTKLGMGSSAAMTAALVRLLSDESDESTLLSQAIACHRAFQDGKGSGADIALSIMDRTIRFQQGQTPTAMTLPHDLFMLAIWTGVSASTTEFIGRLEAWRQNAAIRFEHHISRLTDSAADFSAATETDQLLTILRDYDRYLDEFSRESGINFYNQPHLALRKEVESARCVYKPSGAGGGDFGIAFSADKNDLTILAEKIEREGRLAFFL